MPDDEHVNAEARQYDHAAIVPYVVGAAVLMQTADITAISTALPRIASSLGIDPINATLAITVYLVGMALAVPAGGWMADRFGGRNVLRWAIAIQVAASLACALAPNFAVLVIARFCGGLAASTMLPVGRLTVIRSAPPGQIVSAVTTFATTGLLGPMLGPVIGGALVQFTGWRAVFGIMVPIGILLFAAITRYAPDDRRESPGSLDLLGLFLSGSGLAALIGAMELLVHGDSVLATIVLAAFGIGCFGLLWLHSGRASQPLVQFDLLRRDILRLSILTDFAMRMLISAGPLLISLQLQIGLGQSALMAGVILLVPTVGVFGMKPGLSYGSRAWGMPRTMQVGGILGSVTFAALAIWPNAPLVITLLVLGIHGLGRGVVTNGGTVLNFAGVSADEMGATTGLTALFQQIPTVMGMAATTLLLRLFSSGPLDERAIGATMLVMAAIAFVSVPLAARIPRGVEPARQRLR